jgi:hypothetical protein
MRVPEDADHRFRFMPITDSAPCRSPIPVKPITRSDHGDHPSAGDPAGRVEA